MLELFVKWAIPIYLHVHMTACQGMKNQRASLLAERRKEQKTDHDITKREKKRLGI